MCTYSKLLVIFCRSGHNNDVCNKILCVCMCSCIMMCMYYYYCMCRWLYNDSRPVYVNWTEDYLIRNNNDYDCVEFTANGWRPAQGFCESIRLPFICKTPGKPWSSLGGEMHRANGALFTLSRHCTFASTISARPQVKLHSPHENKMVV